MAESMNGLKRSHRCGGVVPVECGRNRHCYGMGGQTEK